MRVNVILTNANSRLSYWSAIQSFTVVTNLLWFSVWATLKVRS